MVVFYEVFCVESLWSFLPSFFAVVKKSDFIAKICYKFVSHCSSGALDLVA